MNHDYAYPLRTAADRFATRVAIRYRGTSWTFAEADAVTDRIAAACERRGLSGASALLLLNNEPLTVFAMLGLARAGITAVPVNPRLTVNEIAFQLEDSASTVIIADAAFVEVARQLASTHPTVRLVVTANVADPADGEARLEDLADEAGAPTTVVDSSSTAQIVYTSGTTGFPKGVIRTHEANLWTTVNHALGQPRAAEDVELFVLPLFGIAFVFQVLPTLMQGGTVVLDGGFDPARAWEVLETENVTRAFFAPTMLSSMLEVEGHERYDVSALTTLNSAYEFPVKVREAAERRFGPVIAYMYGLSESQLTASTKEAFAADPTNAGPAMGLSRVRAVGPAGEVLPPGEVGEIVLQGPSTMAGYLNRPEINATTVVDGWLHTGDIGYVDAHGAVHMSGRKKEIIKTGGFAVDPVEVENCLLTHDEIAEAAVIGIPDDHWGQRIVAYVVRRAEISEADVIAHVRAGLATFKAPKDVCFVPELPKTPTGKIQRAELRKIEHKKMGTPTA
ncbi:class I adenylate-forming enzyme family protein [Nocardioides marmotae]|uniref:class I adenylate-forming enzyme family protein n=1 Tax=Nocardioides marmotae TaxID=2663857 RepID=UPI00149597BA|nr:AMP-binding protein [Nocardioides marmotae]QKE00058.1 AMP-binding protein [Nocardioides marmotae]